MTRWRSIWTWIRAEGGYTFSLNFAFLSVTVGMIFLLILAWFASGLAAGTELRRAAAAAALAAQSQVTPSISASGAGFLTSAGWALNGSYTAAAEQTFAGEVSDLHLNQAFENLSCQTGVNGNRVTVIVSGEFLPIFLQSAATRVPGLKAFAVPMQVTVPVEYKVVGEGGS
ncbi:hypothetical protein [Ferroacidibacillus organovorans]|uniref:Uncharacterized protein n=1 Tax=Ferroacidibacillus organovorans TaxID=1765683 RepID=A0A853KC07_9BACL|nr:hypothetical protein [Ferroacidibacillus organovorans]KYP79897.1 hypothetical protein AYJ22_03080 [Ferroacidibacillus organovorans]OAG94625.1 hypothetical protein AYW79_04535 [Ferroacidibacillus organovorans]